MISTDMLSELLSDAQHTQADKVLFCLASRPEPVALAELRALLQDYGARNVRRWNLSAICTRLSGSIVSIQGKWKVTTAGATRVHQLIGDKWVSPALAANMVNLRKLAETLPESGVRAFAMEAVACLECRAFRAAIIMSWVGAVALLYDHVIKSHLPAFNAEAQRRDQKWRTAQSADDLSRMKEADFLNVLAAISVLGKNVKQELEACLTRRNGCGHPNSLVAGETVAAAHVETLINNVYLPIQS